MYAKIFKLNKRKFRKRKLTILQHKLRVVMKCYTILDFDLDDEKQTFKFKKSHKINGLRMDDPKEYLGRFEIEELDGQDISLKIIIGKGDAN